jgi:hypothetical protein
MRFARQQKIGRTDLRVELESTRNATPKKKIRVEELHLGLRVIGVLALLMLAAVGWIMVKRDFVPPQIQTGRTCSPHPISKPVLAIEFIETPEQVCGILGTGESWKHNSQAMRDDVRRDYYFIASYALLYLSVSLLLARRSNAWAVYLAFVATVCAVTAALFDVRENMAILKLLAETPPDQLTVNAVRFAATIKWILIFVTSAILALTFLGSDRWVSLIGVLLTLTALLGLVAIFNLKFLSYALFPVPGTLILLAVLALVQPRRFVGLY